jgi:hypothetical protein
VDAKSAFVIRTGDNPLDLLNDSPRLQSTTGDTVRQSDQSRDPDDQTREIVERKQQHDSHDQPPPPSRYPVRQESILVSGFLT